ncbi:MAG TPA: hypothetical protein VK400_20180 [Pyrinomonadaceae bacterium]|nr:hypothetical protein [Pyrinomonadaceae bacterium]
MAEKTSKYSRRTIALFGLFILGILIAVLVGMQQIAVLYVLATISLVALLLTVAFADLEKVGRETADGFAPRNE